MFLYSINWVPPLAPTPSDFLPLPKPSESFFVLAHVEAQSVKTRGPYPNPTAQAQSKSCLPLFTKTQNIIKILPAGLPNPMLFWYLFRPFSLLVPTRHQHGPQGYPNGAQGCRNEAPRSPQTLGPKCSKASQLYPMCVKTETQGATMEPKGHPKCQRDTTRPYKVPRRPKKHVHTARGRVLAEGDVDTYRGTSPPGCM